jgi:NAD(P)-dependent dehydrogenase (short-subunit alcohol dehydrogenase family)
MSVSTSEPRVVVVTGGGSGIGRAVALTFAARGWHVAIIGRRHEALAETIQLAAENAPRLSAHPCDLRNVRAVQEMAAKTITAWGRVDVLVNAAGINLTHRALADFTVAGYEDVIATNLHGVVHGTMAFLPLMRRQGEGTIININSEAGQTASGRAGAAYVVSKFGVTGFTQTLNLEERVHGIRACSIFPGDVDTPLVDRRPTPPPPDVRAKFLKPEDVAEAAWFVASLPARAVVEEILIRQA